MSRARKILVTSATALLAVLVVLGAMMWLSGVMRSGRIAPGKLALPKEEVQGRRIVVKKVQHPRVADVVGSIQAEIRTTITGRLIANIVEMKVSAGDRVSKDQVLVVLDDRDHRARRAQATEVLKAAEAKEKMTGIELDRVSELVAKKVATAYELDQWRANYATAVADVARSQQAVKEAEVALSDTQLRSPIDGIVIDRQAEPGDQASPGRPLLTVYGPSRLRLEASVREAYTGKLERGQKIPVLVEALKQTREGTVQEIVPVSDPNSRSFLVKVHLTDPAGLYPGMFGRLQLPLEAQPRLEIPAAAVETVGQLSLVRVLTDGGGGTLRRAIRVGEQSGEVVEVLAGLREGETVVQMTR